MMLLRTRRLVLRDFESSDWRAMFAIESDPEAVRYQSFEPRTAEQCRAYIARDFGARGEGRTCFDLAVERSEDGRYIGRVGLNVLGTRRGVASLWFMFDRALWGNGYGTEASRGLVDHGFRAMALRRVFLECDPRNAAAARVAVKLGMAREGHLRECCFFKGEWCDSLLYAVLVHEWQG